MIHNATAGLPTVEDIRHDWLIYLLETKGYTIADLNELRGKTRTDGTLSQIRNRIKLPSGRLKGMGFDLARDLEAATGHVYGMFDHPMAGNPVATAWVKYRTASEAKRELVDWILDSQGDRQKSPAWLKGDHALALLAIEQSIQQYLDAKSSRRQSATG